MEHLLGTMGLVWDPRDFFRPPGLFETPGFIGDSGDFWRPRGLLETPWEIMGPPGPHEIFWDLRDESRLCRISRGDAKHFPNNEACIF